MERALCSAALPLCMVTGGASTELQEVVQTPLKGSTACEAPRTYQIGRSSTLGGGRLREAACTTGSPKQAIHPDETAST